MVWRLFLVEERQTYLAGIDFVTAEGIVVGTHLEGIECVTFTVGGVLGSWMGIRRR